MPILLVVLFSLPAYCALVPYARYVETPQGSRELIEFSKKQINDALVVAGVREESFPQSIEEHSPHPFRGKVVELYSKNESDLLGWISARNVLPPTNVPDSLDDAQARDEVLTLVSNGPSQNRIDLVLMGDGYTAEEREKFIEDAKRLTHDIFQTNTFSSYLSLFNVHLVFRPSAESGIGKNDVPKNTAYGLYRVGKNTLRAIYPSKTQALRTSCSKAPGCDYPIVVANDPHYGGLGGEFAITTSSVTSGSMVLRHELGHNFGRVGEEYDGGGYFGANHSSSLANLSWSHWLNGNEVKKQPTIARFIGWVWHDLSSGKLGIDFKSDGKWHKADITYSASGVETDKDLAIKIDGVGIGFQSPAHSDRAYHDIILATGFAAGNHRLEFEQGVADGNNAVSNITIFEYGAGYQDAEGYVGAFPMFSTQLSEDGYRPTHNTCLMREMRSKRFCQVCQENNWLQFFRKVTVIDGVDVQKTAQEVMVTVRTPALSPLAVRWYQNGSLVPELSDKLSWTSADVPSGRWEVEVSFSTPEVRKDPSKLLTARKVVSF